MLTSGIDFTNFKSKKNLILKKKIKLLFKEKNEIIKSLSKNYLFSYNKKNLKKYFKSTNFRIIGMGGSSLGSKAIYDFLNFKIKKNFLFIDNLQTSTKADKKNIQT